MILTKTEMLQDKKVENTISELENSKGLHLRLCITERCPNRCLYCTPGGEGGGIRYKPLHQDLVPLEFVSLIKIVSSVYPVNYLKLTGGEPCERNDLCLIIELLKTNFETSKIEMVTRSEKLYHLLPELLSAGLEGLTVSLDTTDPQKHMHITGRDTLKELIRGIYQVTNLGLRLTLNCVPLKEINTNKKEILHLICLAKDVGADVKLIDLMDLKQNSRFLERYYFPLSLLREELKKEASQHEIVKPLGGLGTPMHVFTIEGVKVKMRDSNIGTHYSERCKNCHNYPCADGRMALRITSDGCLKTCLLRTDCVNLKEVLDTICDFQASKFVSKN